MYDVIIIGGGVVGCAVARELSRYRVKTLLLEKTNDICNGQSKANTAIIHGGYDAKPGTLKAKFNVLGNAMFDRIHEELDVPVQWNTSLVVSFSLEDHPALEKLLEQGRQNGCRGELRIIDEAELRQREPNVGQEAKEALLVGAGGIVCPYELTVAFAENAAKNGVEEKILFAEGDLFRAKTKSEKSLSRRSYDIICANPPYVPTAEIEELEPEVRDHDPLLALDGGADGLDFYRRLAKDAPAHLNEGGKILLEIGCGQGADVIRIFAETGWREGRVEQDLSGRDRVFSALKP